LGTGIVNHGSAVLLRDLPEGIHKLTVAFTPDGDYYSASTSSEVVITAGATSSGTASTTTLTASGTSTTPGMPITFTVTVSGSGATPTGTVYFSGLSTLYQASLQNGSATFTYYTWYEGTIAVTATYGGDTTYATSVSDVVSVVIARI